MTTSARSTSFVIIEGQGELVSALGNSPIRIVYGGYGSFSFSLASTKTDIGKVQPLIDKSIDATDGIPLFSRYAIGTQIYEGTPGEQGIPQAAFGEGALSDKPEDAIRGHVIIDHQNKDMITVYIMNNYYAKASGQAVFTNEGFKSVKLQSNTAGDVQKTAQDNPQYKELVTLIETAAKPQALPV